MEDYNQQQPYNNQGYGNQNYGNQNYGNQNYGGPNYDYNNNYDPGYDGGGQEYPHGNTSREFS